MTQWARAARPRRSSSHFHGPGRGLPVARTVTRRPGGVHWPPGTDPAVAHRTTGGNIGSLASLRRPAADPGH